VTLSDSKLHHPKILVLHTSLDGIRLGIVQLDKVTCLIEYDLAKRGISLT
jgi:hypothetical protein